MIRIKHWLPSILILILASGSAFSQDSNFFPVDDLREGMTGTGLTVFHGTEIEEFDVEILGVLKNSSAKQDMILARLAGGPLAETGVMQGMSGSPVYIDGRLVGAVAFAFDSSQEPIAGIQPIEQMISVLDIPQTELADNGGAFRAPALPVEGPREYLFRVMTGLRSGQPIGDYLYPANLLGSDGPTGFPAMGGMRPIRTPLFLSGLSQAAVGAFSGVFEKFGMTTVQGGGVGTAGQLSGTTPVEIRPGMSINAEMIRGDITVSANGTVTHVDGDKVYAFGHPFQSTGPADLPMSVGYVMTLVPTRTNSFRIAAPLDVVGAFEQDRSTGIMGRLGVDARMIPVRVQMQTSGGATEVYQYEIINDRFMTPLMMNLSLFELILATERSLGALTLEVDGEIRLRNGETVEIDTAASGDINAPAEATLSAVAPITYLLSGVYDPLGIVSIDLSIRANDQRRSARLESVRIDRDEVRAGETVQVEALLRTPSGEEFRERYDVPIPAGLAPGRVEVLIGDGVAVTGADFRRAPPAPPRDMAQVLRELRSIRKSDRLYVKVIASTPGAVIGGAELPSLPPSMLAVLESGRRSDSYTSATRTSPVLEFELASSGYVVEGQQSLGVTIVP